MPRGEKKGNREMKKPKQDKNKVKASAAPVSPFASGSKAPLPVAGKKQK